MEYYEFKDTYETIIDNLNLISFHVVVISVGALPILQNLHSLINFLWLSRVFTFDMALLDLMLLQQRSLDEPFTANQADERLFAGVTADMDFHVADLVKSSVAMRAFVRSLICVSSGRRVQ